MRKKTYADARCPYRKRGYRKRREETLDRNLRRSRIGRGYGHVKQTAEL
jgi:hypothetical protein